jgi:hypothetical protein
MLSSSSRRVLSAPKHGAVTRAYAGLCIQMRTLMQRPRRPSLLGAIGVVLSIHNRIYATHIVISLRKRVHTRPTSLHLTLPISQRDRGSARSVRCSCMRPTRRWEACKSAKVYVWQGLGRGLPSSQQQAAGETREQDGLGLTPATAGSAWIWSHDAYNVTNILRNRGQRQIVGAVPLNGRAASAAAPPLGGVGMVHRAPRPSQARQPAGGQRWRHVAAATKR